MTNNLVAVKNLNQAPLALRPRDAARALGISERTLWSLTAPRGALPDR